MCVNRDLDHIVGVKSICFKDKNKRTIGVTGPEANSGHEAWKEVKLAWNETLIGFLGNERMRNLSLIIERH